MKFMFPLIAIAAFFLLGIAFFVIGKDDFGIKRVKGESNDSNLKDKEVRNPESDQKNNSPEETKELVRAESSSEFDSSMNKSD